MTQMTQEAVSSRAEPPITMKGSEHEDPRKAAGLAHTLGTTVRNPSISVRRISKGNAKMRIFELGASDPLDEGEREADEDIARGRVETFDTLEDLLEDLQNDE